MTPAEIEKETTALNALSVSFMRNFTRLENAMAELLHQVLFCKEVAAGMKPVESRIAHAMYFTPEGFGQRQNIVNSAVTEWLAENPIGQFDFFALWKDVNGHLNTLKGTRNLIAHGSTQTIMVRDALYVRVLYPTYHPKQADRLFKGSRGRSLSELTRDEKGLGQMIPCIEEMARVFEYHDEGAQTWQQIFDALQFHLSQLSTTFPDAQKPPKC